MDRDNSGMNSLLIFFRFIFKRLIIRLGVISMQEFADVCVFLANHNGSKFDEQQVMDLAKSIDLDKNGVIDFNEFLEAFRIVDIGDLDREPS